MVKERAVSLPRRRHYVLANARVPLGCLEGVDHGAFDACVDRLAAVDIEVKDGKITAIAPAGALSVARSLLGSPMRLDLHGKMVLPTFVDLHTHIGNTLMP